MENERNLYHDLDSILYSREEIAAAVRALGERITADYRGKKPVFICILKGASVFFSDLIRQVDLPLEIEFMAVSSYGASTKSSGEVRLVKDLDRSILGRDVIIVEDIVDSGMTLHFLKKLLITRGAASLRIAALMDKPARRVAPLTVDYSCFQIPDAFVVGYGLDYNEVYRNLPDVGVLSPRLKIQGFFRKSQPRGMEITICLFRRLYDILFTFHLTNLRTPLSWMTQNL